MAAVVLQKQRRNGAAAKCSPLVARMSRFGTLGKLRILNLRVAPSGLRRRTRRSSSPCPR
ncbi:MAG: hypothetical protein QOG66_1711 [Methylobacteriaceae bacterium]|jgi:hypothetical protein|nr:hypothetical protein [Methylobacteriaceae bacterium]